MLPLLASVDQVMIFFFIFMFALTSYQALMIDSASSSFSFYEIILTDCSVAGFELMWHPTVVYKIVVIFHLLLECSS